MERESYSSCEAAGDKEWAHTTSVSNEETTKNYETI